MLDAVFYEVPMRRSRLLGEACMTGFRSLGLEARVRWARDFREPEARVAVHYGLSQNIPEIRSAYRCAGRPSVLLDLGYWGRWLDNRYDGYHRFAVRSLHERPIGPMPHDRIGKFQIERRSMDRGGSHVLLCGQSEKAARVYCLLPEQWERDAVGRLSTCTDRSVWYMPKGSWRGKGPLPGTEYHDEALRGLLEDAWACVAHHSNSAIHALALGVPVFVVDGAAKTMSGGPLLDIETPTRFCDEDVSQFLADVAYLQWTPEEMASGKFWLHLMEHHL